MQIRNLYSTQKNSLRQVDDSYKSTLSPMKCQIQSKCSLPKQPIIEFANRNANGTSQTNSIMRLMQEQLQISKKVYEQKMKQMLRLNSMQISKLQTQVALNSKMLSGKDQQIYQLKQKIIKYQQNYTVINQGMITNPQKNTVQQTTIKRMYSQKTNNDQVIFTQNDHLRTRIKDIQIKLSILNQQITQSVDSFKQHLYKIQNNIIKYYAHKLKSLKTTIQQYMIGNNTRIGQLQLSVNNMVNRQIAMNKVAQKNNQNNQVLQFKSILEKITKNMDSLRKDTTQFMNKQIKYENYNIENLSKSINKLQNQIKHLQKIAKQQSEQNRLTLIDRYQPKVKTDYLLQQNHTPNLLAQQQSQVKKNSTKKSNNHQRSRVVSRTSNISINKFQDYHQNINENQNASMISASDDYFFYTEHNDSFQRFTSEEEDELSTSEYRLIETLKLKRQKFPVLIEADRTGCIRKKGSKEYIKDKDNNFFTLGKIQLLRLKERNIIAF